MKRHELKCWPQFFDALVTGDKTFEFRRNDRGYAVGDILVLQEWDPIDDVGYTGREIELKVTYVLDLNEFVAHGKPVLPGYVILGLESLLERNLRADLEAMQNRSRAAERDIKAMLGECLCETRHEYCGKVLLPGGCNSDDCSCDAVWRGPVKANTGKTDTGKTDKTDYWNAPGGVLHI